MQEKINAILKKTFPGASDWKIEISKEARFGHYSSAAAFGQARAEGRDAMEIASALAGRIQAADQGRLFEKVTVTSPGFINFWLSKEAIQEEFLAIKKAGGKWGKPSLKKRETAVIDYSHPNIAKPMSVAHLRSTIIGQALYNIFQFSGYKVVGDNHLGDWGKQFGVLIAAFKNSKLDLRRATMEDLFNLYVDYTGRLKANPALEEAARLETKKLQEGNEENIKIWEKFYALSLTEFKKIYKALGVKFDYFLGESFYKKMLPGVVGDALRAGAAKRSAGAVIVEFPDLPPFIIQKSDDAYLYATTDIAAVKYRIKKFKPQLLLYVVDNGQTLHFEQLFRTVRKLGYVKDEKLVHVKFGLILSEDMKKLSTRAGRHIALGAVIEEAIKRAGKIVRTKRPDLTPKEQNLIAYQVGVGSLKYNDLSQNRQSDIAFNWDKMMSLEGNSAPYLMYTYARLRSIMRKGKLKAFAPGTLRKTADLELVLKLSQFREVIARVLGDYFPHELADYLYGLAKKVNYFYQTEPVLKSEPELKAMRLCLVDQVAKTLKTGLALLGIKVLERM